MGAGLSQQLEALEKQDVPQRNAGDNGPSMPSTKTHNSTGTLGKALEVLDLIVSSPKPLRFTEILNTLDQPRGTLHRQISNLIEEGLVELDIDNSYAPGARLLTFAARAWSKNSFRSVAEPHIRALHEATGETVHLGQINDLQVIYLDKIESNQTVRMYSQVGNASPLYCTGIGKAMLALVPEHEAYERVMRMNLVRHTPTTLHTPKLLLEELDIIRETGISHDREEHEPGIRCVAAGIRNFSSGTVAGVSVTAPAFRVDDEIINKWEELVGHAARSIESDLAAKLGPRHQE